jgi:hypothetical protein
MHSWNTSGARTSHKQTQTQKIHHYLDLGEATTFPVRQLLSLYLRFYKVTMLESTNATDEGRMWMYV